MGIIIAMIKIKRIIVAVVVTVKVIEPHVIEKNKRNVKKYDEGYKINYGKLVIRSYIMDKPMPRRVS